MVFLIFALQAFRNLHLEQWVFVLSSCWKESCFVYCGCILCKRSLSWQWKAKFIKTYY